MEICPNCLGRGTILGPKSVAPGFQRRKECPTCGGSGEVDPRIADWIECHECDGWGEVGMLIGQVTCTECNGYGFRPTRSRVERVPRNGFPDSD